MSITQSVSRDPIRSPRRRFCGNAPGPSNPKGSLPDLCLEQELMREILPHALLEKLAAQTQAQDQRKRKLTCVIFFWLMILVVGPGGR